MLLSVLMLDEEVVGSWETRGGKQGRQMWVKTDSTHSRVFALWWMASSSFSSPTYSSVYIHIFLMFMNIFEKDVVNALTRSRGIIELKLTEALGYLLLCCERNSF